MWRHEQEVAALGRHHAEFGGRRLRAHAEEAERCADQDDLAEAQVRNTKIVEMQLSVR